jgi:hypothetical protein
MLTDPSPPPDGPAALFPRGEPSQPAQPVPSCLLSGSVGHVAQLTSWDLLMCLPSQLHDLLALVFLLFCQIIASSSFLRKSFCLALCSVGKIFISPSTFIKNVRRFRIPD